MKISELYGKQIESAEGKAGYVVGALARGDRLEFLECADRDENEFAVDWRDILSIEEKIVFEDREHALKEAKPLRLGRAAFDADGNFLGRLEDFTFEDGRLTSAKIGKKNYCPKDVACGDAAILKTENKKTAENAPKTNGDAKKGGFV